MCRPCPVFEVSASRVPDFNWCKEMIDNLFPEQIDALCDQLSSSLSVECDEDFFPTMSLHLARILDADYALICELLPDDQEQVTSLGFVVDGQLADNITYPLEGTPCEQIIDCNACVFEQGVQEKFPQDADLVKMGTVGYAGVPLRSASGEPLGLACVLFRQPISNPKQIECLLKIFAVRVSSELERRRNRAILDSKNHELHLQSLRFEALYQLSQMAPDDTQAIKEFALEAAMQITQSSIGYIFLLNEDESVLSLHVWSKSVMAACKVFEPQTEFKVADTGLWGEPIRQRKPVIDNDYLTPSPVKKGLPQGHVPITRHLNVPVFDQDKIVMLVGVSNKQEPYNEEDARHLTLLMDGLWRALSRNHFVAVLHEREQSFRRFYENSPLSYQSLNGEGRFLDVNPAWVETFGYEREEILGRKFSDLMTTESESLVATRFPTLKLKGEIHDAAFEITHKDGHTVLTNLHGRASYDERGDFQHTNCILTDVTKARRAEARLRQSEAQNRMLSLQFQTLLDSIPDRILLLDPEMRIIWTNQKHDPSQRPLDKDPTGDFCYAVMHGNSSPCPECPALHSFATGQLEQYERVNPDGFTWLQRAFPICDDNGNVLNVVEIGQNITEKVQLQKETARTGQLAAIGELAAGVAHEINNPITGVINYAQLLKNRSEAESQEYDLSDRIIKEGDRVARIVKQLLFIARDEATDFKLIDLAEALSDSLSLVGSQFTSEGIDIEITLAEKLPLMSGHAQQMEQLFLNLFSNARYALNRRYQQSNSNKRIEVKVDCEETDSGKKLIVLFRDHGIGIPADLLPKVLQPFFTSKPSSEGTGLGLSISNDIVNRHGGSLHIESEEERYTEVVVRFPAHSQASF